MLVSENWWEWIEHKEQYFVENEVKEEHKIPIHIVTAGPAAYELLLDLCRAYCIAIVSHR